MDQLKHICTLFLNDAKTLDQGQKILVDHASIEIDGLSNTQVRKLLSALVLYKFPNEEKLMMDESRTLILSILKSEVTPECIQTYLQAFDEFKKKDFEKYVYDLAGSYFNLVDLLDKVDQESEWILNIQQLCDKIKNQVKKIKGEDLFEKYLQMLENVKLQTTTHLVEEIFWKKMKEDIENQEYGHVLVQLVEIKSLLRELMGEKENTIDERIDIEYIKQRLNQNDFTPQLLSGIIDYIFDKVIRYGIPIYDKVMNETRDHLLKDISHGLTPELIVSSIKISTKVLLDLLIVVRTYREKMIQKK
jgi:hypothetical protein